MQSGRAVRRARFHLPLFAVALAFALSACNLNPQPEVPSDEGSGGASGASGETNPVPPMAIDGDAGWPGPQGAPGVPGADPNDGRKQSDNGAAAARPGFRGPADAGSDSDAEAPPTVAM